MKTKTRKRFITKAECPNCFHYCKHYGTTLGDYERYKCARCGWVWMARVR